MSWVFVSLSLSPYFFYCDSLFLCLFHKRRHWIIWKLKEHSIKPEMLFIADQGNGSRRKTDCFDARGMGFYCYPQIALLLCAFAKMWLLEYIRFFRTVWWFNFMFGTRHAGLIANIVPSICIVWEETQKWRKLPLKTKKTLNHEKL